MTIQANGQQSPFDVAASEVLKQTIRDLHAVADQRGQGKLFIASFRHIYSRLKGDPNDFGDPLFNLASLQLLVFHAVVWPVVVHYGVHQERRLVVLRHVKLLD